MFARIDYAAGAKALGMALLPAAVLIYDPGVLAKRHGLPAETRPAVGNLSAALKRLVQRAVGARTFTGNRDINE